MVEVPRLRVRDADEAAQLHQETSVPVEHEDVPVGDREGESQPERRSASHATLGVEVVDLTLARFVPGNDGLHRRDADGAAATGGENLDCFLPTHNVRIPPPARLWLDEPVSS